LVIFVCGLDANGGYKGGNILVCNGWLRLVFFIVDTLIGLYWLINSSGIYNKFLDTVTRLLDCNVICEILVLKYYIFSLQIK